MLCDTENFITPTGSVILIPSVKETHKYKTLLNLYTSALSSTHSRLSCELIYTACVFVEGKPIVIQ